MRLREVQSILRAEVLTDVGRLEDDVEMAFGADLMSDILAMCREQTLLLTGMTHVQVIRTAEISDLAAIVFVRGKRPSPEIVELAEETGIPLLLSRLTMYESCGLLYSAGLSGINRDTEPHRGITSARAKKG